MIEYNELYNDVKNALSEKRFKHTEGVEKRAIEYAKVYNVDIEKARFAAICHDIAKEMSLEESYKILEKNGVLLDDIEKKNFNLIHAKVGAVIAKNKYNLEEEIVNSIKFHTTGKENMTILEKIIYLADATEPRKRLYEKSK